jgi:amino acid adenylation domain-containing protein
MQVDVDPFGGPEIIRLAPSTESQLEIWVSCVLGGEDANRSYNESVSLRLSGEFDLHALEKALQQIVARHEALRSAFSGDGKHICVFKELPTNLHIQDISSKTEREQQAFIIAFSKKDASTAFDLLNGPLFRIALFQLGSREHYLKITAHHIVCDGWSLGIILQDLSKLYSGYSRGETPSLPEPFNFSQYAVEQWEFSESEEYKKIENYWIEQYRNDVPVLDIPTDFPRPLHRTYKSQRDDYPLGGELISSIKKMGAKAGSSFVTTLLTAFEVFLHRLTAQSDIVLGLPAAGQSASGHYTLVGHCVNLLPLKSHHNGEQSFLEFLKLRKVKVLDDYDHQQFTFGSLLKKLNISRDPSRVPLVPVIFNIDMGLDDGVDFSSLTHKMVYNPREYENFEIFLNVSGSERALTFEWSYNTQLFKSASIKRMMDDFEFLLKTIITEPGLKIKDIPRTTQNELASKLKKWNDTSVYYSKEKTLIDLLAETVRQYPDKVAVRYNNQTLTYEELENSSNQFARVLTENKIQRGDLIGLAVDRSSEMLIALLAIMKTGAAYIPIDPEFPQKRIEFMLNDSATKILVTSKKYKGRFHAKAKEILIEEAWDKMSTYSVASMHREISGVDLAYVLYTSGSTGNPKGVQIEHHNLFNFLLSMQKAPGMNSGDCLLAITTISFDIAGLELYLPLISGAELVIADAETAKDGRRLLDLIESDGITVMQATPSTWRMMLDAGWQKRVDLKILCGGEGLPKDIADKLLVRCGSLWNMYGPTETTIWSTVKQIRKDDEIISIGRPIDNTEVYILDEYLNPLPESVVGEIFIAGAGVARGYLHRDELTREKFCDNLFEKNSSEKMYRTGDLGRFLEGGEIQCLGRIDHQVKIRGYRIELGEIEQGLLKQKGIKEAVVIALNERLVAYIVPSSIEKIAADLHFQSEEFAKWKQGLRESMPDYMVPGDLVLLEKLPLTPNGKIDRNALPKPGHLATGHSKKYVAPRTDTEKLIAGIWSEVLKVQDVGINDDFFELGGHSLIAVQAMTRLEKSTGKRLPLASLLEAPTVEKLSLLVQKDEKAIVWDSLVPIKTSGTKLPIYIVHGIGMNVLLFNNVAKNMDADQPVYALQAKGLKSADESFDRMEDIAAHYISEILAQDPHDEFALAGYSFGGIIAFEMAKQLKALGKDIRMLAMFDTNADNSDYFDEPAVKFRRKIIRQFPKMLFVLRSFFQRPAQTFRYQREFFISKVKTLSERFSKKASRKEKSNEDILADRYDYAYQNYKMTPYEGAIDLFKVQTRLYYIDDMKYMGWKPFASKGIYPHVTPGDHKTFLYPPYDRDFARILQKVLDERTVVKKESFKNSVRGELKAV